jgi:uncharacterized protein YhbP (UPF0306 family)
MTIERSHRPIASRRLADMVRRVMNDSALCAIATVSSGRSAHVNTAYFAWSPAFEVVWLSEPRARHSRNIKADGTVAIAVYDSHQSWGDHDRGIQLFGSARELEAEAARDAETLYAARFPDYVGRNLQFRFYLFRPKRLKVFDEDTLGAGVFVTARAAADGRLTWERTEIYRPEA